MSMDQPSGKSESHPSRWVAKRAPVAIGLRLLPPELALVDKAARAAGMTKAAWTRGCVMRVVAAQPTFPHDDALALVQIRMELRRIGLAVRMLAANAERSQISRDVIDDAWRLHGQIRGQLEGVRAAVLGNLRYWDGGDD